MFPVIRSRSGSSHILAAVETLSPPLTAPELGTALLALWDRWEGTPCWEELPPELTEVPFWKGTARSYRAFFRAHRLIVAAFGHPNPGDISLAYWPRHLENNSWGVVKGQVELQVRLDRELPDLPPEDRYGGPAAAGRGGADGSHHAGDWKITGGIAFIYHILLRIKRYF